MYPLVIHPHCSVNHPSPHIKETIKNNAYSAALNKVQPADMSKVREGLVRNMVKAGLPISVAESKVDEIMSTL